jgi:gamma-glutamyltranspeptidase/glutathione hydrolase
MSEARRFGLGCVASPNYLASAAGLATLADGGNALDAAIAINLTLAVVSPYMCGFGGDLFAIIWDGSRLHAYNGSGRSPAAATLDAAARAIGSDRMPGLGPHTVTVPGAVEAWFTLLGRFGSRSFEELSARPLRYAREGFPLTARAAATLSGPAARYQGAAHDEWNRIYGGATAGERFVQPQLARTIEVLRRGGPKLYYEGEIAEGIVGFLNAHGSLMALEDFAEHSGDWVEPLSTSYRGTEIVEMPPNTQGVVALEALNILEALPASAPATLERHHHMVEAVKLALEDRGKYVTDPDHMPVPAASLATKEWADIRRQEVDPHRARRPQGAYLADQGTAYMCAADEDGMCVSLIQSNFSGFGSGVTVPGFGINLQNRGSSFSLDLADVNVIAPRKRPMHTLIPAMAMREGRPSLVFGSMGGHGQAQTHVQLVSRIVDDGYDVQQAIDAPRWVVSPASWVLSAESRFPAELLDAMREHGHQVEAVGPMTAQMGHAHAISIEPDGYAGACDPRSEGAVLGL